jgi:hypothetical protein
MGLFKSKGLDEEVQEYLEQELEDLAWLDEHLRTLDKDKSREEVLDQTSDKIKQVNKLLKKLKG